MNVMKKSAPEKKPILVKVGGTTAKIYSGRSRGYLLYTLVYYLGGRRVRRTFSNLTEARREGELAVIKVESGQSGVLELRSNDRDSYVHAMQELQPLGVPLHSAISEFVAASRALSGRSILEAAKEYAARHMHEIQPRRASEVFEEMMAAKKQDGLSQRYLLSLRSHLSRFVASFQTNIGSINAREIETWLRSMGNKGRTRNNLRMSIITLFRFARARGYLLKHQATEADAVAKAKDKGGEIGILTPQALCRLLAEAKPEVACYLAFGAFTGLRSAEIGRLEWRDVNLDRGYVEVHAKKAKTATRRLVPILPNFASWLSSVTRRDGHVVSTRGVRRALAWAAKCGVGWPTNCLRHSYATYRLAHIHDAARVALELGNSPAMLFSNYRELVTEKEAAAWFSIVPEQQEHKP